MREEVLICFFTGNFDVLSRARTEETETNDEGLVQGASA
jgi:hypothetical protein